MLAESRSLSTSQNHCTEGEIQCMKEKYKCILGSVQVEGRRGENWKYLNQN